MWWNRSATRCFARIAGLRGGFAELLRAAGFEVIARLVRVPRSGERFEHKIVLCWKPP